MAEILTPQQEMAVHNRGGKLLVSAAAGSGKTKVLIDRLLSYILDPADPANIDDFLLITYTKAAASELRGKIASKLTERIAEDPENLHLQRQLQRLYLAKISTVHSFCSDILREYAYHLDISGDFRVGDESECVPLQTKALEQTLEEAYQNADPDFTAFADSQGIGRSDALLPEIIKKVFDSARCHLDFDGWLSECIASAETENLDDAGKTVWGAYLMQELFQFLDLYISSIETCIRRVSAVEGLEKSVLNLSDTLSQLRYLRESVTWDDVVARKDIQYGKLVFSKKANDPAVTEPVKTVRKFYKDQLEKKLCVFSDTSDVVLEDLSSSAAAARGLVGAVRSFRDHYDRLKKTHHILDFGDLEHKMLDLLLGRSRSMPTVAAREIGKRFREIMVDEYQDSHAVQDAIFAALSHEKQNLFLVGDVKQSIYQFRLADPNIFLAKYRAFAPAETAQPGQGRKVMLSHNFRSSGGVIAGVNDIFFDCMSKEVGGLDYTGEEALHEGIAHIPLEEPEVELHGIPVRGDTYGEEAAFVAERIAELTDGTHFVRQKDTLRPITPADIVILLRSPGPVGHRYAMALEARGIRCTTGGGSDLLQTPEIAALRSLLQILSNPRQDIPLVAALASPLFGFTAEDLAQLRSGCRRGCIYDALQAWDGEKGRAFLSLFSELRSLVRLCTLPELLEKIFLLTDMQAVYAAMEGGDLRLSNLRAFYSLAVAYESSGPKDLEQFLSYLDSMEKKGLIAEQESDGNCVTVMSIHKSKGLEFPVVFLCGLSRQFNREDLKAQVLCHQELGLGLCCVDAEKQIRYPTISKRAIAAKILSESTSEEMRVLYVALTRARDRLIMTYASDSLESDLSSIVHRMDICPRELITGIVSCPGTWVLYSALRRIEAGAFFAVSDRPDSTRVSENVWKITVSQAPEVTQGSAQYVQNEPAPLPEGLMDALTKGLSFHYPHTAAAAAPSKQTATQRKGRPKDQEAAEQASEPKQITRSWRKPSFRDDAPTGTEYGSAIHSVMQYIRFDRCTSEADVVREVERLAEEGYLSQRQAVLADCRSIASFFQSPFGHKLRTSENVLREFKFSILDDAAGYSPDLAGEHVLLQGVVDCAVIEPDGIILVDYKTDRVTADTLPDTVRRYRGQVLAYAEALSRIFRKPVKESYLYFFRLNRFVPV